MTPYDVIVINIAYCLLKYFFWSHSQTFRLGIRMNCGVEASLALNFMIQ